MDLWRQKGPLGKLHNIVVFFHRSPQREETFLYLSHGKHLIRDQQTRWNSWFAMVDRAIQADIRIAIDLSCFQYKTYILLNTLAPEEWAKLEHIHEVLQAFQRQPLQQKGDGLHLKESCLRWIINILLQCKSQNPNIWVYITARSQDNRQLELLGQYVSTNHHPLCARNTLRKTFIS